VEEKREEKLLLIREGETTNQSGGHIINNQNRQLSNQPGYKKVRLLGSQPDNK
jgi:hypothetical protein